jgi:CRISPR-associated endonuclease/helicase Cas3
MKSSFRTLFERLTGRKPFPWQERLFDRLVTGAVPTSCQIPTGLGKTAVMAVWLIARTIAPDKLPRRLVYVVNRRTVVDQASDEARRWQDTIENNSALQSSLGALCVSTLRGEQAETNDWWLDPSRSAIIVGTVDLIGSRLLFQGYRAGYRRRPLFAGFLGQDALIIHDEAHLEPAFHSLLLSIKKEQEREPAARGRERLRLKVLELTATPRPLPDVEPSAPEDCIQLGDDDYAHPIVRQRLSATKELHLHEDGGKLAETMLKLIRAHENSGQAVLVFADRLEDIEKLVAKLPAERTLPLTGTIRGRERDALVQKPVFQRFLQVSDRVENIELPQDTVYLVASSAGEVGVNMSADHLVCDLVTYERMAQRLGRVNRFGVDERGRSHVARVDVVFTSEMKEKFKGEKLVQLAAAKRSTLELLRRLDGDACPQTLQKLPQRLREQSYSPLPDILPVSNVLFDAWSLTTLRRDLPGRPLVAEYLHGANEPESARTHVAWRNEVEWLTPDLLLEPSDAQDLLDDCPLKSFELLSDRTDRVWRQLEQIIERAGVEQRERWAWIQDTEGAVRIERLDRLKNPVTGKSALNLEGVTILLPPATGGLGHGGQLDGSQVFADDRDRHDIADEWFETVDGAQERRRARIRIVRDHDGERPDEQLKVGETLNRAMRLVRTIALPSPGDEENGATYLWKWYVRPRSADDEGSRSSRRVVMYQQHVDDVVANLERLMTDLPVGPLEKRALLFAAEAHDVGKCTEPWQESIGNFDGKQGTYWAKSDRPSTRRLSYRHEFASLLDIATKSSCPEEIQELAMHLVGSHHGCGRPHFGESQTRDARHGQRRSRAVAAEVPGRFGRLQRQYGRWGLAYLESLLRAADAAASSAEASPSGRDEGRA